MIRQRKGATIQYDFSTANLRRAENIRKCAKSFASADHRMFFEFLLDHPDGGRVGYGEWMCLSNGRREAILQMRTVSQEMSEAFFAEFLRVGVLGLAIYIAEAADAQETCSGFVQTRSWATAIAELLDPLCLSESQLNGLADSLNKLCYQPFIRKVPSDIDLFDDSPKVQEWRRLVAARRVARQNLVNAVARQSTSREPRSHLRLVCKGEWE